MPAGWQLGQAIQADHAVFAVATAPLGSGGLPGAQSVVVRLPLDGSTGATSAVLPTVGQITYQASRLWAAAGASDASTAHELVELDPMTLRAARSVPVDGPPESLAAGAGGVWVGTSNGVLERIDTASGAIGPRIPGGYEVTALALSPHGQLLFEAINNSLTVIERDASSGAVLHSKSLPGIAGGGLEAASGTVWVHFATGMADEVQGLRASDLSSLATLGGIDVDESAERLGAALVGPTLFVTGYEKAGCFDAATGRPAATFALPTAANTTIYTAGPDGMFTVTTAGPHPVAVPLPCTNGGSGASARAILSPATVGPVSDECTLPLTYYQDGNAGPLLCRGGGVNVFAWQDFVEGQVSGGPRSWSQTMALGPNATANQVWQAMCADKPRIYGTNPRTISAEKLAAAYYGWNFHGSDPATQFQQNGCPAK
ncbi:MAG TPA: hypothetical protein VFA11_09630 [Acidimicrobiales bacterium]|nr:hypothetical protein [Acidimicrobiales bacterium]